MTGSGPLSGRRVVVTRSRPQARSLCVLLEADGADVIEFPAIRVSPPSDYGPVDRAIERLADYQWIAFTSQNAVTAFTERLQARGGDAALLARLRVAAIGPATAHALSAHGLRPHLSPARFVAEALVDAFAGAYPQGLRGTRVLVPRALDARTVLPDGLRALGAVVDVVPVYRVEAERKQGAAAWQRLLHETVDAVTFTSPSTVRHFVELLGASSPRVLDPALVACIGPITAAAARAFGLSVGLVAETYTIPGLVDALRGRLGRAAYTAKRLEQTT
jgi:uroporphyrinogen III methyltransferase / synthase